MENTENVNNPTETNDGQIPEGKELEVLKYFQDEFKFRCTHFWNISIKMFLLIVAVSVLPLFNSFWGMVLGDLPNPKWTLIFPILAILITILSIVILWQEEKRLQYTKDMKYDIKNKYIKSYSYDEYINAKKTKDDNVVEDGITDNGKHLSLLVIWFFGIVEFAIIGLSAVIIYCKFF